MDEMAKQQHEQEIRKSLVRVHVTYLMSGAYALASLGLMAWLLFRGNNELAIGVFSGLASTSATIIAFWFGSRGPARPPSEDRQ